jgi:DMSO/TMAO reductase YedYZ heme-binding membrane subunit
MIVMPPVIVGRSGTASADTLWTTLRLAALEAFTLVFASILTSTFRPLLVRIAPARTVQRLHATTGLAGFSIAVAHAVMAAVFGITGYRATPLWLGPVALALLALAVCGALARRRLRSAWRWVHRANYMVFVVALVHGLAIGYDVKSALFLKICLWVYAAAFAAGVAYRLAGTARRAKPDA